MDTSLYVGLSDQMALQRRMEIIANNLANMTTTAFKGESVLFQTYLQRMQGTDTPATSNVSYVQDYGVVRDLAPGHMDVTGNPLDLAINGDGYFTVQNAQGQQLYTRDGHFEMSSNYEMVTSNGLPVLDSSGKPITFLPTDTGITVSADGVISTRERGQIGKIQVVNFANGQHMESVGDSLYSTSQAPAPAPEARVSQGMLESSNVKPIVEMTNMISVSRQYQEVANILDRQDQLKHEAITSLPQVQ